MATINENFRPTKAGSPRANGQLPGGDGSLSRSSSINQGGTIGQASGAIGNEGSIRDVSAVPSTFKPAYQSGSKQNFKPTSKGGVR